MGDGQAAGQAGRRRQRGQRGSGPRAARAGGKQAGRSDPEHMSLIVRFIALSELRLPTSDSVSAIVGKTSRVALWECLPTASVLQYRPVGGI